MPISPHTHGFRSISLDYIRTTEDSRGGVGIAYAYLKYDSREHQNPARVLASFLKQLCQKLDEVPEDIFNIFLKFERNDKAPTVREYYQMLYDIAVNYFQEVILVLDALDECDQDRREELIKYIFDLADAHPCMRVLVTSRRETDIEDEFNNRNTPTIQIEAASVHSDIQLYVRHMVDDLVRRRKLKVSSRPLKEKIKTTLMENAQGM